ncbi:RNA polymerase sigma-70 factor (ECF subfamily) [Hymenobacter luteus]|uniref:RNA polymerase sigma-70 factor (ECF subfamily) n=2 Tax=Hymenobacter TaxID=89966 RepID=A0A7W9WAV6_9BACT|nr:MULTISPECIES: sigma-70 family RNA polymerase sigma factor [Hymenobacter]MBB4601435.1 RNA polymerase sigma-70 factor (ECF subfamily) [Hymenobacter latericoloratus]MBB6058358.1 RNA polymerase sigma-70 factor (ECF subfamily) [Hymenobacter luteus]
MRREQNTDADLVAACRRGSAAAQEQLYQRFAPKMLALCLCYVHHQFDAEDVLARGFVKVFRYLGQFEGKGSLEGWVRRIMVHEALSCLRRRESLTLHLEDCYTGHLATDLPNAEAELQAADLLRLVQELPAGYRAVFNLCALEGYTHPEAAALLGISEGTSKSQLSKARAVLQRQVAALQSSLSTSYAHAHVA